MSKQAFDIDEGLVEKPSSEPFADSGGQPEQPDFRPRFTVRVREDGGFDWDGMRDSTCERLKQAMRTDASSLAIINPEAAQGGIVQEKHIEGILQLLGYVERWALPAYIEKAAKLKIRPQIVQQTCRFTEQQLKELLPAGAATANELLPEGVKLWLVKGSNTAQFFGGLLLCVQEHAQMMVAMELQARQTDPQPPQTPTPQTAAEA